MNGELRQRPSEGELCQAKLIVANVTRSRPDVSQIVQILHESLDQKH